MRIHHVLVAVGVWFVLVFGGSALAEDYAIQERLGRAWTREVIGLDLTAKQAAAVRELPQASRSVLAELDVSGMAVLRAAANAPAYFVAADLVDGGARLVEAEEELRLLTILGFVRRVVVRGQVCYRLVDAVTERTIPEGLAG